MLVALWLAALNFVLPESVIAFDELTAAKISPDREIGVSAPNDFLAFWAAGRLAAVGHPGDAYLIDKLFTVEQLDKRVSGLQLPWVYPPPSMLPPLLFQALPFLSGFAVWTVVLLTISIFMLRLANLPWPVIAAGCVSPAALLNLGLGQLGIVLGALILAALSLAPRKPGVSGLLFGLLVIRPQLGLLAPLIFLRRSRWAGLAGGITSAVMFCGFASLLLGPDIWRSYIMNGLPIAHFMMIEPFPAGPAPQISSYEYYGISVFWMLRSFGLGLGVSAAGQALASLAAIGICWRLWRHETANPVARIALTIGLGLLASPYGYLYDLSGFCIAIAALVWLERELLLSDVLLWTWPVTGLIISRRMDLELAPLVICLSSWRCAMALHLGNPVQSAISQTAGLTQPRQLP